LTFHWFSSLLFGSQLPNPVIFILLTLLLTFVQRNFPFYVGITPTPFCSFFISNEATEVLFTSLLFLSPSFYNIRTSINFSTFRICPSLQNVRKLPDFGFSLAYFT
jgi:hypothetical protein